MGLEFPPKPATSRSHDQIHSAAISLRDFDDLQALTIGRFLDHTDNGSNSLILLHRWTSDLNASSTPAYRQAAMYDLNALSKMTGWSNRQLRTRLDACGTLLDDHMSTGRHGRILLDDYGASLLRRMYELENDGHTVELAVNLLSQELQDSHENGVDEVSSNGHANGDLVVELRSQIEYLRKENAWLRERVETLEPLALPPARRSWLSRLLGR